MAIPLGFLSDEIKKKLETLKTSDKMEQGFCVETLNLICKTLSEDAREKLLSELSAFISSVDTTSEDGINKKEKQCLDQLDQSFSLSSNLAIQLHIKDIFNSIANTIRDEGDFFDKELWLPFIVAIKEQFKAVSPIDRLLEELDKLNEEGNRNYINDLENVKDRIRYVFEEESHKSSREKEMYKKNRINILNVIIDKLVPIQKHLAEQKSLKEKEISALKEQLRTMPVAVSVSAVADKVRAFGSTVKNKETIRRETLEGQITQAQAELRDINIRIEKNGETLNFYMNKRKSIIEREARMESYERYEKQGLLDENPELRKKDKLEKEIQILQQQIAVFQARDRYIPLSEEERKKLDGYNRKLEEKEAELRLINEDLNAWKEEAVSIYNSYGFDAIMNLEHRLKHIRDTLEKSEAEDLNLLCKQHCRALLTIKLAAS